MTMNDALMKEMEDKVSSMKLNGATRKELTFYVARRLSMEGINPSVLQVRAITEQGSTTDIAKDLKECREEIAKSLKRRTLKTSLPDEYMVLVESMIEQIWTGASDLATKEFDAQRAEIEAEKEAAARQAETTLALLDAEKQHGTRLREELTSERQLREEAEQRNAALASERDQLSQSVNEWQANTEAERSSREKEREQAAREMEAMRAAHQRAMEQAEGDRKYVMLQLDQAREAERSLRAQLLQAENDRIAQNERQRIEVNNLRDKNGAMSLEIGELRGEQKANQSLIASMKQRIAELENKLDAYTTERAEEAARQLQAAAVEKILVEARNAPNVFEAVDSHGYEVKAEFNPAKKKPELWLENEQGEEVSQRYASVATLDKYCASLIKE